MVFFTQCISHTLIDSLISTIINIILYPSLFIVCVHVYVTLIYVTFYACACLREKFKLGHVLECSGGVFFAVGGEWLVAVL